MTQKLQKFKESINNAESDEAIYDIYEAFLYENAKDYDTMFALKNDKNINQRLFKVNWKLEKLSDDDMHKKLELFGELMDSTLRSFQYISDKIKFGENIKAFSWLQYYNYWLGSPEGMRWLQTLLELKSTPEAKVYIEGVKKSKENKLNQEFIQKWNNGSATLSNLSRALELGCLKISDTVVLRPTKSLINHEIGEKFIKWFPSGQVFAQIFHDGTSPMAIIMEGERSGEYVVIEGRQSHESHRFHELRQVLFTCTMSVSE